MCQVAHRGVLTGAEIAAWSATVETSIGYDYPRYRVQKLGPWCQGLVTLQQLAILKRFQFEDLARWDPISSIGRSKPRSLPRGS
jgi:gamma-glutamyltranspeptidase/glutathione hydrolase